MTTVQSFANASILPMKTKPDVVLKLDRHLFDWQRGTGTGSIVTHLTRLLFTSGYCADTTSLTHEESYTKNVLIRKLIKKSNCDSRKHGFRFSQLLNSCDRFILIPVSGYFLISDQKILNISKPCEEEL